MKSEDLLDSLDYVGEDLLASAESSLLVTKRHPWWRAAAAVLALIAAAGGLTWFLIRQHKQQKRNREVAAETVTMPEFTDAFSESDPIQPDDPSEPTVPVGQLARFPVGRSWVYDLSAWTFDDLDRSLRVNRWTLDTGAERLPVYEVLSVQTGVEGARYSQEELLAIMTDAINRLGQAPVKDIEVHDDAIGEPVGEIEVHDNTIGGILFLTAGTELGEVTVYPDGRVQLLFDEDHRISAQVKIDFEHELSGWEMDAEYRDAIMEECGEKVEELLGLPPCHRAICDRYSRLSSNYTAYLLYPIREDPVEQLKSRSLEAVRLLTVDGRTTLGLEWYRLPEAGETCAVPEGWRLLGDYPIISADEAKQAVLRGAYLTKSPRAPLVTEENLAWGELVYLPDTETGFALPFYRFWIPCREGEVTSLMDCAAVYVPAVDQDYLTDYPKEKPVVIDEPEPSEPITEPVSVEETDPPVEPDPPETEGIVTPTETDPTEEPVPTETDPIEEPVPTETDPIEEPTPTEPEERPAAEGCFSPVYTEERTYFTDGQTELWLEDGAVRKKDLGSGEIQTLFALEPNEEIRTELVGVTARRLYFGWRYDVDWWGMNVYSVDYQNGDRQELADGQLVSCKDGWILLEDFVTDVRPTKLRVIGSDDRTVVNVRESWGGAVIDGCVWYIYAPALQDAAALDAMSQEARDELLGNVEYEVCLVEREGDCVKNAAVCTITQPYYAAYFQIDPESRTIRQTLEWDGTEPLDLLTLKANAENQGEEKPNEPTPAEPEEPKDRVPEAQKLSLRDCFFGYGAPKPEYRYYRDIDREMVLSPWSDQDEETAQYLDAYPEEWSYAFPKGPLLFVHRNAAMPVPGGEGWAYQCRDYMEEQARYRIEGRGGVIESMSWGTSVEWDGGTAENEYVHGTEESVYWDTLRVKYDGGELIWYGNGDMTWIFDEPMEIPAPPEDYEPDYPFPSEPLKVENYDAYLCAWTESLISDGASPIALIPEHAIRYDPAGNRTEKVFVVMNEAYPHEDAYSFSFSCVSLELDSQGRLLSYSLGSTDLSEWLSGNDAPSHSLCKESAAPKGTPSGYYPWISRNEADAAFRSGNYFTTADPAHFPEHRVVGDLLLEHAVHVEIVYKTDNAKLILPFYRYWVELDSSDLPEGLTRYGAFYVPAISAAYLKDWPAELMPGAGPTPAD